MTLSTVFIMVGRRFVGVLASFGVPKALETVITPHNGSQQIDVVLARRARSTKAASFCANSLADTLYLLVHLSGVRNGSQRFQITSVGCHADFWVTRHVAHAVSALLIAGYRYGQWRRTPQTVCPLRARAPGWADTVSS